MLWFIWCFLIWFAVWIIWSRVFLRWSGQSELLFYYWLCWAVFWGRLLNIVVVVKPFFIDIPSSDVWWGVIGHEQRDKYGVCGIFFATSVINTVVVCSTGGLIDFWMGWHGRFPRMDGLFLVQVSFFNLIFNLVWCGWNFGHSQMVEIAQWG